jgi:curved DNA-binding protein
MQFKDYYKLLGVARGASADEIKKAYRKQARKFHPDMNKSSTATQSMSDINEAHDVLSDVQKREAYDTLGTQRDDPPGQDPRAGGQSFHKPGNWSDFYPFSNGAGDSGATGTHSDFFEQLFGNRGQPRQSPSGPMRGADQQATIALDLRDAYLGAQKTLSVRSVDNQTGESGSLTDLQVSIPIGVFEGQKIRLAGHGSAGSFGGPAGDLLLAVHFRADSSWRTKGRDVYGPLLLTPWEAVLSPWLEVGTPVGKAEVKIPADWKLGRTIRLKAHGIPASASSGSARPAAGDLYLELAVALPPANTGAARDAYVAMEHAFPDFHPRAV